MKVIFFGPPGVGKGTQAQMVAEKKNWRVLSMGDLLRDEVKTKSTIGIEVEELIQRGSLVPDELILRFVDDFIIENRDTGLIFDGFPRNLNQAIALEQALSRQNEAVSFALGFTLSHKDLIYRLTNRRYCPRCNKIYNIYTQPPQAEGICDQCGGKLVQRDDDREEVIIERLKVYEIETKALVDYYTALGIYQQIDARGTMEEVFLRVMAVIDAHNA